MALKRIVMLLACLLRGSGLLLLLAGTVPFVLGEAQVLFSAILLLFASTPVALVSGLWVIGLGQSLMRPSAVLLAAVPAATLVVAVLARSVNGRSDWVLAGWAFRHHGVVRAILLLSAFLAVSTLLLRPASLGAGTLWSLAIFVMWAQLPATGRPSYMSVMASLVLSTVTTVLCLLAAEVFVRSFVPDPPFVANRDLYMHHRETGFTLSPGFEGTISFALGPDRCSTFPVTISSQGLRDREYGPKQPGEFRILLLGDSFAMGWSLPLEQSFGKVLEQQLRRAGLPVAVQVVIGGVGSFGPWQERVFLHERCMALEPDLVLHQLLPSNDVENTLWKTDEVLQAYNAGATGAFMSFRAASRFPHNIEWACLDNSALYRLVLRALNRDALVASALRQIRFLPEDVTIELPPSAPRTFNVEVMLREPYPTLEKGWAMMLDDILAIHDDCQRAGIPYVGLVIPEMVGIVEESWQWATRTFAEHTYERGRDVRLVEEFFAAKGISYLTLYEELRAKQTAKEPLYFKYDGHFTEFGAKIAGESLARQLIDMNLLPTGLAE
jgi:hypothetical protein